MPSIETYSNRCFPSRRSCADTFSGDGGGVADELGFIAASMDESASIGETVGVSFDPENIARAQVATVSRKIVKFDRSGFIRREELSTTVVRRLRNLHDDVEPPVVRFEPISCVDELCCRVDCGGGEE